MIAAHDITGLVLAGGQGSRMGGVDKGLQTLHGVPLVLHALRRLQPQVGPLLINANRNPAAYAAWGVPVCADDVPGFAGPLAGFLAGLARCRTPWLLTVACDTPLFPADLAHRLASAATLQQADIAVPLARGGDAGSGPNEPLHPQPVFCLMRASLHDRLAHYLGAGGRTVGAWMAQERCTRVPFDQPGDDPRAFLNLNTLDELRQLEQAGADRG